MELRDKEILITGGTGFIGSALAKELVKHNKVLVVGRNQKTIYPGVTFIKGDVTKKSFIKSLDLGEFDYIFHLAGNTNHNFAFSDPLKDLKINFLSTFYILEVLRRLKRRPMLIFASSVLAYGESKKKLNEDFSLTVPTANYGASKLAAERYVYAFSRQYKIPAISLRIFSTYGPGLYQRIIYDFIKKLHENPDCLEIIGSGNEARDLVFIDDQIENIIRVAESAEYEGEVYNLGSGRAYTTKQIAGAVARSMKLNPEFIFSQKTRLFDVNITLADTNKIKKLGCKTQTSLDEGIKRMVSWYRLSVNPEGFK